MGRALNSNKTAKTQTPQITATVVNPRSTWTCAFNASCYIAFWYNSDAACNPQYVPAGSTWHIYYNGSGDMGTIGNSAANKFTNNTDCYLSVIAIAYGTH